MRDEIRRLIANVLNVDKIPDEWDSVHHLELMLAIEEQFGVTMTAEEMTRLTSLDAIERYLS